jgi:hypothetical protein
VDAVFDEANLVSCAGLVAVMGPAEQVGLAGLVGARVRPDLSTGSNPGAKAVHRRDRPHLDTAMTSPRTENLRNAGSAA